MTRDTLPGDRLRALAARVCGPAAMTRMIDPVIADLQSEYAGTIRRGQIWRSRWIRCAGYVAFWKVIGLHATARAVPALREWAAADDRAIGRTLAFTFGASVVVAMALALHLLPGVRDAPERAASLPLAQYEIAGLYLGLVLRLLPFGLEMGFIVGVLCGLRGRLATTRVRRFVVMVGVASSVPLFAITRETTNAPGGLGAQFGHHQHWAFSLTHLVMGLFAYHLSAAMEGRAGSIPIGIMALLAYVGCYVLSFMVCMATIGWLPPLIAAWLPNLIFASLTVALARLVASDP